MFSFDRKSRDFHPPLFALSDVIMFPSILNGLVGWWTSEIHFVGCLVLLSSNISLCSQRTLPGNSLFLFKLTITSSDSYRAFDPCKLQSESGIIEKRSGFTADGGHPTSHPAGHPVGRSFSMAESSERGRCPSSTYVACDRRKHNRRHSSGIPSHTRTNPAT